MKLMRRIYSIYVMFTFIVLFFLLFPWLYLFATKTKWHRHALLLNHYWAVLFFRAAFLKYHIEWRFHPDHNQQYILCANHFSFLDIPAMGLLPIPFKFVGKSSLTSIPLFGYMYRRIHITVNRNSFKSKKESFQQSKFALEQGFNIAFFPEGGIFSSDPPHMTPLKEGAFVLSVEKGIPIIPIALLNNHQILPDDNTFIFKRIPCYIIVFPPIVPRQNSEGEVDRMLETTRKTIQSALNEEGNSMLFS